MTVATMDLPLNSTSNPPEEPSMLAKAFHAAVDTVSKALTEAYNVVRETFINSPVLTTFGIDMLTGGHLTSRFLETTATVGADLIGSAAEAVLPDWSISNLMPSMPWD